MKRFLTVLIIIIMLIPISIRAWEINDSSEYVSGDIVIDEVFLSAKIGEHIFIVCGDEDNDNAMQTISSTDASVASGTLESTQSMKPEYWESVVIQMGEIVNAPSYFIIHTHEAGTTDVVLTLLTPNGWYDVNTETDYPNVRQWKWICHVTVEGFDPDNIVEARLLNNQSGLPLVGHQAILLIDKNGYSEYYSFAPMFMDSLIMQIMTALTLNPANPISVPGQMTKAELNIKETADFKISGQSLKIPGQNYDRQISYSVSVKNGRAMYDMAVSIYSEQPNYRLTGGQCDNKVGEILKAGGIDYDVLMGPNMSYYYALAKQDPLFDNRTAVGAMGY